MLAKQNERGLVVPNKWNSNAANVKNSHCPKGWD